MSTYTVTERGGCRIVSGDVPLSAFSMLAHGLPKNAVMDPDLARMMNASFAIGAPADIASLKSDPDVLAQARIQTLVLSKQLSPAAQEWLATGEHGTSSMAMFTRFTGVGEKSVAHPHDPDDFRRCRLLLEQVPEFVELLPIIGDVSPVWAALVDQWSTLVIAMDAESPNWRDGKGAAPKMYNLMKTIGC